MLTGRAHLKHTEGGDFRQATYRALRQGLRRAESVLLEPVYAFSLEVPAEYVGRAMRDIQRMQGHFDPPEIAGEYAVLVGTVRFSEMGNYQRESHRLYQRTRQADVRPERIRALSQRPGSGGSGGLRPGRGYGKTPAAPCSAPMGRDLWCPGIRWKTICIWKNAICRKKSGKKGRRPWA